MLLPLSTSRPPPATVYSPRDSRLAAEGGKSALTLAGSDGRAVAHRPWAPLGWKYEPSGAAHDGGLSL